MTRYRLSPSPAQEEVLRDHCRHARFVWNLAVEQRSWWRPGRKNAPGFAEHCHQLTQARAEHEWLAAGSVMVQQQALRDFSQAVANYFAGTHRQPTWRPGREPASGEHDPVRERHPDRTRAKRTGQGGVEPGNPRFGMGNPRSAAGAESPPAG